MFIEKETCSLPETFFKITEDVCIVRYQFLKMNENKSLYIFLTSSMNINIISMYVVLC